MDKQEPPSTLEPLSIGDVAGKLDVSSASVRNWLKAGFLKSIDGNRIDAESLRLFEANHVGKNKLNHRANKSKLDSHNHNDAQAAILSRIGQLASAELSSVGSDYESSLSNSYRNKEGIYYTPEDIIDDFFVQFKRAQSKRAQSGLSSNKDIKDLLFLDPCCGSGNFLLGAIKHGFSPENVFGYDCDAVAVEISRARIREASGYESETVQCQDFLANAIANNSGRQFDVIFTNPPWGKRISPDQKQLYAVAFGSLHSADTSSLFLFAALNALNDKGVMGFLMPDSFFNIATFREAREKLLETNLISVTDYAKPFKGLMTGAVGFVTGSERANTNNDDVTCRAMAQRHVRSQKSFAKNPKSIINYAASPADADTLVHLYERSHVTLANNATWALGIVTGNNQKFLSPELKPAHVQVFKGSDITCAGLKDSPFSIPRDFSQYQQVAPEQIYFAKEKIAYKFISNNLCFFHDTKQSIFLNSANMFVLNENFALTHEQLTWLLNTELINWIFRTLFFTHKVLRSDLETLPVFHDYFNQTKRYDEQELLDYLGVERCDGGFRKS